MKVKDYSKQDSTYCLEHARSCALATIEHLYKDNEEDCRLNDIEIDKLKDALQALMYIKSLETERH